MGGMRKGKGEVWKGNGMGGKEEGKEWKRWVKIVLIRVKKKRR